MTTQSVIATWPDTISFDRLHALAKRGYQAHLGTACDDIGFSRIDLKHPRSTGEYVPPSVTIWSNGILATDQLLWPTKYVLQEEGPPSWQKFIATSDAKSFDEFVQSVPLPSFFDLYGRPMLANAKVFAAHLLFGASLCCVIAAAFKLLLIVL